MATWYRTGTVTVTNGSPTVSGSGTAWVANAKVGEAFLAPDDNLYEIAAVVSDTQITLAQNYLGNNQAAQDYAIIPVRGVLKEAYDALSSAIAAMNAHISGALAGRFGAGSTAAPSLAGAADTNTGIRFPGSDQLEAITNGIRRVLLSTTAMQVDVPIIGTAVQSSTTDATAEKLMKVGAFGVGGRTIEYSGSVDDPTLPSGMYFAQTGSTGTKPGSLTYGNFIVLRRNADERVSQIWTYDGGHMYKRSYVTSGGWSAWQRVLHDAELQTSLHDTTANRILKAGAFGWGQAGNIQSNVDPNTVITSGVHQVGSANANSPISTGHSLLVIRYAASWVTQLAFAANSTLAYIRRTQDNGATWSAWSKFILSDDVQTSASDATAGKVMSVGAFGLGATIMEYNSGTDLNATTATSKFFGWASSSNAPANAPSASAYGCVGLEMLATANRRAQLLIEVQSAPTRSPRAWIRAKDSDWAAWYRLLTSDDLQASVTDATAGKLMGVGAFGLGAAAPLILATDVVDNSIAPGIYQYDTSKGSTGGPTSVVYGTLIHMRRTSTGGETQILTSDASALVGNTYTRTRVNGGWTSWRLLYSQGNIVGTVSVSSGIPTGAIIERGTNANGDYTKFADGTLHCWTTLLITAGEVTWTFPVAYIAAPIVFGTADTTAGRFVTTRNRSTTGITVNMWHHDGTAIEAAARLLCIGRWY